MTEFSDEELASAVTFLEKAITAKGAALPEKKGPRWLNKVSDHPLTPIVPTTAPNPTNAPMNISPLDQAYKAMDERYEASIRTTPLAQGETEAMRRSSLTENDSAYREAARAALAEARKTESVSKAQQELQAWVAKQIEEKGAEFAAQQGITVEKARTMLRKAYPKAAAIEMGRA